MAWHNVETLGFEWESDTDSEEDLDIKQEALLETEAEILADIALGIEPEYENTDDEEEPSAEVESGLEDVAAEVRGGQLVEDTEWLVPEAAEVRGDHLVEDMVWPVHEEAEVRGDHLAEDTEWPIPEAPMTDLDPFNNNNNILYGEISRTGFSESVNSEQNAINIAIQRSLNDFRSSTNRPALGMPSNNKHFEDSRKLLRLKVLERKHLGTKFDFIIII